MLAVNSAGSKLIDSIKTNVSKQAFEMATGRSTTDFESYPKFLEFASSKENIKKISKVTSEINSEHSIYIVFIAAVQWVLLFLLPWVATTIVIKIVKDNN